MPNKGTSKLASRPYDLFEISRSQKDTRGRSQIFFCPSLQFFLATYYIASYTKCQIMSHNSLNPFPWNLDSSANIFLWELLLNPLDRRAAQVCKNLTECYRISELKIKVNHQESLNLDLLPKYCNYCLNYESIHRVLY